jgi:hypothetical protein
MQAFHHTVKSTILVKSNKTHFSVIWRFTPSDEILAQTAFNSMSGSQSFHGRLHGLLKKWGKSVPSYVKQQKLFFA